MENTIRKIKSLGADQAVLDQIIPLLQKEIFPKGYLLIQEGKVERSLFFLEQGIARAFLASEDKEVTFWFGAEGEVLLSMNSYFSNQPGYETIELLEKSVVYRIPYVSLMALYQDNLEMANWGRRFAESELIKAEKRFISQRFKPAAERYDEFAQNFPELTGRVQLGHIASYLGVSQVTLSRIRAEYK